LAQLHCDQSQQASVTLPVIDEQDLINLTVLTKDQRFVDRLLHQPNGNGLLFASIEETTIGRTGTLCGCGACCVELKALVAEDEKKHYITN